MSAPAQMNGQGAPDQQDQQQQPPGPPPLSDGTLPVDPRLVTNALLNAVKQCAAGAASASGQDAKDFLNAALNGAQAIVILDPSLAQGGTPIAHDLAIEAQRGQTQENVARIQGQAQLAATSVNAAASRESAAAPTPARRKGVSVRAQTP